MSGRLRDADIDADAEVARQVDSGALVKLCERTSPMVREEKRRRLARRRREDRCRATRIKANSRESTVGSFRLSTEEQHCVDELITDSPRAPA